MPLAVLKAWTDVYRVLYENTGVLLQCCLGSLIAGYPVEYQGKERAYIFKGTGDSLMILTIP